VPAGSPFFAYIETAHAHGILRGYGATFHPNTLATRGQVSGILAAAVAVKAPDWP